ncbi:MAG: carotenoid oxygenase family protein [Burkholderiales bacterium]|nr:carotenoid oxygenase family protein [Burkholderiales bacterium]
MDAILEQNPYLDGEPFAPVTEEATLGETALRIEGTLPRDFGGLYVRNGPNAQFRPEGRYHWFDGDGMLHAIRFADGHATYRNRWVTTSAFAEERAAGRPIWRGIRESANRERREQPFKDTSNTDVKFHNGSLITTWYLCGVPYRVDPLTLATLGPDDFGGKLKTRVSAHIKVDETNWDLMFFDYGIRKPYMTYGVVGADGVLKHHVPIDLPGPRLPHDMSITENYSILMDLPVFQDMDAARAGRWKTDWHADMPARFGILPRYGDTKDVRWFEAESCYIYHSTNAWEEGTGDDKTIVMEAFKFERPFADYPDGATEFDRMLHNHRINAHLQRYRFHLKSGKTTEEPVTRDIGEFGMINTRMNGRKTRYVYGNGFDYDEMPVRFKSLMRWDTEARTTESFEFAPAFNASEPQFCARDGATAEDDGYVVTFLHNSDTRQGECWLFDARAIAAGPLAKVHIPQRLPAGFHGIWVPQEYLK